MTPKEKAKELEEKFRLYVLDYHGSGLNSFKAKQCAIITVDELIKETDWIETFYWKEVKQEIEKL